MQSSIEKLRKLFRIEHEKGYSNVAVQGGLVNILNHWQGEARGEHIPEEIIQAAGRILGDYAGQTVVERAASLKAFWQEILVKLPDNRPPRGDSRQNRRQKQPGTPQQSPRPVQRSENENSTAAVNAPGRAAEQGKPLQVSPDEIPTKPGRAGSQPGGVTSKRPIALNASLTVLAGVGPKNAAMLTRLGLNTLGDMLYNYPRRYEDYSQLKPIRDVFYGQQVTVIGTLTMVEGRSLRGGGKSIVEAVINDGTAGLRLTWFNQPWLTNRLKVGAAISVSGKVEQYLGRLVMNSPDWEPVEEENLHTNRIVPVYGLTANVTQKFLRKNMHQVVTYWAPRLPDHLPETIRRETALPEIGEALLQVHFPDSSDSLESARRRLAFDEVFFLQTGMLRKRREWQSVPGRVFEVQDAWLEQMYKSLPYT